MDFVSCCDFFKINPTLFTQLRGSLKSPRITGMPFRIRQGFYQMPVLYILFI